jgi:nucleotide-binding universal stress UspA family protein
MRRQRGQRKENRFFSLAFTPVIIVLELNIKETCSVSKSGEDTMFKKILIAYDGSAGARKALAKAIDMSVCFGGELHTVAVEVDLPHYAATIGEFEEVKRQKDAYFERLNSEAVAMARDKGVGLSPHVLAGHAVDNIVQFCTEGSFDLVVVGFTGHSRIYERIWGGTSRNIARFTPCSVLIVK